ncbi:MAG: DNA adenine methylase [Candidatus Zixiibacteriota bacterium]
MLEIINVASVPQRSPFRYPGGKTWLIPAIRQWLTSLTITPTCLVEPFAGGGIVGLTAAFEGHVDRVLFAEIDPDVAAVWKTMLNGQAKWLADEIVSFQMTHDNLARRLAMGGNGSLRERAFVTILRNRVSRGGILAPGAGVVKKGENGKGLLSRWYPATLKARIEAIARMRYKLEFIEGDGLALLESTRFERGTVFFIDPPYTAAGRRLYTYNEIDHEALFDIARRLTGDFLMTYDNSLEVRKLAERYRFALREVPMKSTHHEQKTELLIGRDLNWLPVGDRSFV